MIIRNLATAVADTRIISATIEWEDQPYPDHVLEFEINDGEITDGRQLDEPFADAFLAALVPQMATSAPASATACAIPRPIPLLPPVTSATSPVRSKGLYMRTCSRDKK